MQRIAFVNLSVGIAVSLIVNLTPVVQAQSAEPDEAPQISAVVGAPFSAVGIQENIRATADGNRFIHKLTSRHYRDGLGRTRVERDLPRPETAVNADESLATIVTINNKVTGEVDSLFTKGKIASVLQRPGTRVVDTPPALPEIFTIFAGVRVGPKDSGWSAPVSLGEKSIEGIPVVGTKRVYTMAAGRVGNQNPVTITVQQWSSPQLGIILDKTSTASTGGSSHYQLTQIVQAEPDAALFKVPADYKKLVVNPKAGTVVEANSTASTTAPAN